MDATMRIVDAPRLVRDWYGQYVRSNTETQNSLAVLPAGTVFKVVGAGIVKYIKSKPCSCCGIAVLISFGCTRAVFERDFDFIALDGEGW